MTGGAVSSLPVLFERLNMANEDPKDSGMGDCVACPHCGKPIYLSDTGGGGGGETQDSGESWENDLRHQLSPRSEDQEAM